MNACLKKNDVAGFKKEFKNTYGVEYNEANIQKYYKNPTDANRATAFGKNQRILTSLNVRKHMFNPTKTEQPSSKQV